MGLTATTQTPREWSDGCAHLRDPDRAIVSAAVAAPGSSSVSSQ